MKPSEMNEDMIKELRNCKSIEEVNKFISDNKIELTPEQLEEISGGNCDAKEYYDHDCDCPVSDSGQCVYEYTGRTKPGAIFGDVWPNYEMKCKYCGQTIWNIWGF